MGGDRRVGACEKRGGRQEKRGQEAGVPRWQEPREIGKNLRNILLYFAIEMGQKGGKKYEKGREARVEDTGSGSFRTPCPSPLCLDTGPCTPYS